MEKQMDEVDLTLKGRFFNDEAKASALQDERDQERDLDEGQELRVNGRLLTPDERRDLRLGTIARSHYGMDI